MIQELFGGAGLNNIGGGGERKLISIHGGNTPSPSLSPSPSPSSSTTTTTATATTTTATGLSNPENLRCPRCDSSNTKFCYYNNYNLTQPRHFCKTCRRYWTKGGALRNVPIGGGCRKNKSATVSTTSIGKTAAAKLKTAVSEIGRSGFGSGLDHEVQSSPILWGSPQNSHLLSLLRVGHQNQNPNPNPNPMLCNSLNVKEEGGMNMIGSHMMTTDQQAMSMARTLGLDPVCQAPSLGLCSSFWRNNNQNQQPPHHNQQNGFVVGHEVPSNNIGLQELFQRLRSSSSGAYYSDNLNNVVMSSSSSSSSTSSILESAAPAVGGGEMGYWNPAFTAWSTDLPTTNGAYH